MPKDKTVDTDQADENATAALDQRIEEVSLAGGGQLVASIVGELIDCWKHLPKPYAQATQGQQQDVFRRFESLAKTLVAQAAQKIAAHQADKSVLCVVGKASIDTDIKVDLKTAPMDSEKRDAAILFLAHARGRHVVLRMASAEEYDQVGVEDPSQPDQADMEFESGDAEIDDEQAAEVGETDDALEGAD